MTYLLLVVLLVWMIWRLAPASSFRIVFRDGEVESRRGKAAPALVAGFEDIARRCRLTGVVSIHRGNLLRFSDSVPEIEQQRFRNVLASMR